MFIKNAETEGVSTIDFLGNATIAKYPELADWELSMQKAQEIPLSEEDLEERTYKPGKLFGLNSAYPVVVSYKNFVGVGYHLNLSDPLNFRQLDMTMSYTPKEWLEYR
ncbi:hypothetical protein [Paraglaciecola sp. 25GB23A]|uniref:hypothetical protein n=1 Tax=Paraglaciecola sp. 25GB23A TaxID=3156068 RepID=UPI0032AF77E7